MKKLVYFFVLFLLQTVVYAQPPQGIAYQGIAYDASGNPVVDQDIKLRISVLNTSASGASLYAETFSYHTNLQGVYSLNIGMGTVVSGNFSTINWGVSNKFLKVEMDVTGGTNYVPVGTAQLMSVPYALYAGNAKKTENGVISVNTITDLKNIAVPAINEVVYVRCHTNMGDNGGGFFRWRNDTALINPSPEPENLYYTQDNNGTLIKSNVSLVGRWVREYDGFINIQFFGVDKDNAQSAIQRAIDFAYYNNALNVSPTKGSTVYVPSGHWITKQIKLKNGVNLMGDTTERTIIAADKNDSNLYLVEMEKGSIRVSISNIKFYSSSESGIGCLHFKAEGTSAESPSGGYWLCEFRNIDIWGFRGHSIFSEGGTAGDYKRPNQFNVFQGININLATNAPSQTCALKMTGQHGQVTFLNCAFNGYKIDLGNETYRFHTGHVVDIASPSPTEKSAVVSFINSTFQEGDYGLYVQNSENVTVDNCWFENVGDAVTVYGQNLICKAISIVNSRFVNAAGYGTLKVDTTNKKQGTCVHVVNSQVTVANNFVNVSNPLASIDDSFILASGLISGGGINEGVEVYGNSFGNTSLSRTYGVRQGISASGGVLNCRHNKLVIAQSGPITRIDSSVSAGEIIYIRASGNVTFNDTTNGTGNVFLTNRSSITLLPNEVAAFMKIDNEIGNEFYQLVSLVKTSTP